MPTFKKHERLCSKKLLDKLFFEGKTTLTYPFKFTYLKINFENSSPVQVVFIVPKKRFRKANKRNLIRRRMREAYRLSKESLYNTLNINNIQCIVSISYVANDILPFITLKEQLAKGLEILPQVQSMKK
jgi:ribonuclease P protein component